MIVKFLPSLIFPLMPTVKVNMNFFSKSVAVTMVSFGMALPNSYSLLMAVFLMFVVSYACCRAVLNSWCTVSCLKVSFTDSWFRLAQLFALACFFFPEWTSSTSCHFRVASCATSLFGTPPAPCCGCLQRRGLPMVSQQYCVVLRHGVVAGPAHMP